MQHTADLLVAPDYGIELAAAGQFVEVERIFAQRIELLRGGLRIDGRTLAERADRLDQLLLGRPGPLEQVGRGTPLGHQSEQQVFHGGVFVAEIAGEVHGPLDHLRAILREKLLTAARHAGQRGHGAVRLVAQPPDIDPHAPQQERGERVVLAHEHAQQVHRLDGLVAALFGQRESLLQGLLRLNS